MWRIKWHPNPRRKEHVLLACMHDGFKTVQLDPALVNEPKILMRFEEHESLAYGVDWSWDDSGEADTVVASGSFYDHSLYMWRA